MAETTGGMGKTNLLLLVICIGVVGFLFGEDVIVDRLGDDLSLFGIEAIEEVPASPVQALLPVTEAGVVPDKGIVVIDLDLYMTDPEVLRQKLTPDQVRTRAAELAREYAADGHAVLLRSDTLAVPASAIVPIF